jgi:hypothetical protein
MNTRTHYGVDSRRTWTTSDNVPYLLVSCKRKVEMSASRKVEISKLPFRQMAEAKIGIFDDEWKRVATH